VGTLQTLVTLRMILIGNVRRLQINRAQVVFAPSADAHTTQSVRTVTGVT
jgi:hypothetical protein